MSVNSINNSTMPHLNNVDAGKVDAQPTNFNETVNAEANSTISYMKSVVLDNLAAAGASVKSGFQTAKEAVSSGAQTLSLVGDFTTLSEGGNQVVAAISNAVSSAATSTLNAASTLGNYVADNRVSNAIGSGASTVAGALSNGASYTGKAVSNSWLPAVGTAGFSFGAYVIGKDGYNDFKNGNKVSGGFKMAGAALLGLAAGSIVKGGVQTAYNNYKA